MSIGLIGKKCGMTRIFTEEGLSVPVTVIEALPNRISQLKEKTNDGYNAVQLSSGNVKKSRMTKAIAGHFASTKTKPGKNINEFRVPKDDQNDYKLGMELTVNIFEKGQKVDVTGKTIGKGFAGTVKRHNFSMQDATHGNSLSHRAPGSIGQNQTPGRVFKGKKMAGHMGNVQRTVQNLEIIDIDLERNLLMIKGAIPGHPGSDVIIKLAVKRNDQVITINRQTETSPAEETSKDTSSETSPAEETSKDTSETSPAEETPDKKLDTKEN